MFWSYPVGMALLLLMVYDVLMTVLYPKADLTAPSQLLNRLLWSIFRLTRPLAPQPLRHFLFPFSGPVMILSIFASWLVLLVLGFAFVVWPALGTDVVKAQGTVDDTFVTALYYAGVTVTTLGYGDIVPAHAQYRLFGFLGSGAGFATFTLVISYLMSVYTTLRRRNAVALNQHLLTRGSGQPTDLLIQLCSSNDPTSVRLRLSKLSEGLQDVAESHHTYPVLHYFQLRQQRYALAQMVGLVAESATLIRALLSPQTCSNLQGSGEVQEALDTCQHLLADLSVSFLPRFRQRQINEWTETAEDARERLKTSRRILHDNGVAVKEIDDDVVQVYMRERSRWAGTVLAFRDHMGWQKTAGV